MPWDQYTDALPGVADGSITLDRSGRAHVESCLRCQAELVRYRRLLRSLHGLRSEWVQAPGLLTDILAALDGVDPDEREARTGRRAAYLSGIAAATAAGAAGAIVFATRVRHRRPLAG